ncbi:MAG: hypothetical protein A3F91_07395 [Flavobacteria bacterium RIFCSPLOWO2_12_FULL_35_11]|nr:MAG: hypothetical protein A3F91_07395 [Flavobacteria bacterium RIFCSPLOWO2_12_FULL_35_11]
MSNIILKIENLSKQYRLGLVGTGTMGDDLKRWWANIRGKEDPFLKIGDINNRATRGTSNYIWALKDINFEVQQGEVLGIIGKNGAGKSTLLKILSKITSPTTGSIKSKGRVASLLEVGTGFHGEMTGRENIYLNGAILGMTKKEINAKLDEIIEFSGCERYIDTPVKRYSSGMTGRLAFAVAAFLEPDILIIDEVLAVGDAEFQKKAIGKMQEISKGGGRTVLFVSHNMAAVKSLCTRGIVLENGGIVYEGSQDESVEFYLSNKNKDQRKTFNLLKREDRLGSGEWKLSQIEILNKKGKIVNEVISGEPINIKLSFEIFEKLDLNKIFLGVAILDPQEQKLVSFLSDEMNLDFKFFENRNFVVLQIPNLFLRASIYSINVQLGHSTKIEDYIDTIEDVSKLHVLPGDFWNTGKVNRSGSFSIFPGRFN